MPRGGKDLRENEYRNAGGHDVPQNIEQSLLAHALTSLSDRVPSVTPSEWISMQAHFIQHHDISTVEPAGASIRSFGSLTVRTRSLPPIGSASLRPRLYALS
jgi:hypothetical protein